MIGSSDSDSDADARRVVRSARDRATDTLRATCDEIRVRARERERGERRLGKDG
jgi:hypothetical protein